MDRIPYRTFSNHINAKKNKQISCAALMIFVYAFTAYIKNNYLINTIPLLLNFLAMLISSLPLWIMIGKNISGLELLGALSMSPYIMHGLALRIITNIELSNRPALLIIYLLLTIIVSFLFLKIARWCSEAVNKLLAV